MAETAAKPSEVHSSLSLPQVARALLITPRLTGRDGISNASRQVAHFILNHDAHFQKLQVWSLADEAGPWESISIDGCSNAKARLITKALTHAFVPASDLVVFMLHVHLAPVALPMVARGAQLVTFLHGVECWKKLTFLQRKALQCSSFVIANSDHTRKNFLSFNHAFQETDIRVCHLGIDGSSPSIERHNPERGPFALIVGRMNASERYKGHDLLLEIWPRLISEVPNARLIVVGEGTDLPRLRSKALELGLNTAVQFLGSISDERLYTLYRDCSFFVMPSQGEGFGLVFLEAMRAGKPCIGAEGAAQEIIEHGSSGYIVRPLCRDELLACIKRLFLDTPLREQMGIAALQQFNSRFTLDQFEKRLYSTLMSENDSQRRNSSAFGLRARGA